MTTPLAALLPLPQPDATTCGSASLVVARMLVEAPYAAWVAADPAARFRSEALAVHDGTCSTRDRRGLPQLPWPRALGTSPWSVRRDLTVLTGRAHRVRVLTTRAARAAGYDEIAGHASAGSPVPLFVGSRLCPRHVVLVVAGDDRALTAYEPGAGDLVAVTRDELVTGPLRTLRWPRAWLAVVPR